MTVGNIAALVQDDVKRMPAYSIVIVISVWALFHMGLFPRDFLLIARKSIGIFM